MHHSYNSVGNIGEQGGRTMVGFLVGCNDAHADVNDIDENYDYYQSHIKIFVI